MLEVRGYKPIFILDALRGKGEFEEETASIYLWHPQSQEAISELILKNKEYGVSDIELDLLLNLLALRTLLDQFEGKITLHLRDQEKALNQAFITYALSLK